MLHILWILRYLIYVFAGEVGLPPETGVKRHRRTVLSCTSTPRMTGTQSPLLLRSQKARVLPVCPPTGNNFEATTTSDRGNSGRFRASHCHAITYRARIGSVATRPHMFNEAAKQAHPDAFLCRVTVFEAVKSNLCLLKHRSNATCCCYSMGSTVCSSGHSQHFEEHILCHSHHPYRHRSSSTRGGAISLQGKRTFQHPIFEPFQARSQDLLSQVLGRRPHQKSRYQLNLASFSLQVMKGSCPRADRCVRIPGSGSRQWLAPLRLSELRDCCEPLFLLSSVVGMPA